MTQTISALFDLYTDAAGAVRELEALGVPRDDISVVASELERRYDDEHSLAAADAGAGAGIGAVVGGAGGLLAGLGMMAIPGIGPVVAAGWLVATAAGAAVGAAAGGAAGGLIGALTEGGVPEDAANVYAEGVRRGGTLVTARVADGLLAPANEVARRFNPVDIGARATLYREGGWARFDPDAPAYTLDGRPRA